MTRPFDAAPAYLAKGWHGTLPLPVGQKEHPPKGYTGAAGGWPTEQTVFGWLRNGASNIALRLDETTVGIDVDAYAPKHGGETLRQLSERWGALPATWASTSRDDGVSGIRLFRIPAGAEAKLNDPGPDIETIRFGHRYIVVAPSLHPEGRRYRWTRPDGATAAEGEYPAPGDLPELPATWLQGMSQHRTKPRLPAGGLAKMGTRTEILSFLGRIARVVPVAEAEYLAMLRAARGDGRIVDLDPARPWTDDDLTVLASEAARWPAEGPPLTIIGTTPAGTDPQGGGAEPPAHLVRQSRAAWYFAQMAGDRVRFDHGRGRWLVWAGHRWRPDEDGSVQRLWLNMLATRYRRALEADDRERVRQTADVQAAGATNAAITAGVEIASSMEPIATKADAWDPDPWLIGCDNGVVDLRTGVLRPGQPEDMISRSTGIMYDPDATCPRWARFLSEVFAGDVDLVAWYGLLMGTSLVGVMQELLALHHGLGNNGKSVAVRAVRHAFGDYAVVIPVETLVSAKRTAGEATPDLMALRGARIAFTSEPDQTAKLRGGVLKRLASIDSMTGRPLYGMTQTWDPTHTVHLSTNHLPEVDDATDGFWRRVALIPWPVHFRKAGEAGDGPEEDPGLTATLTREGPGILAWAVRGAMASAGGQSLHPFPAAVRGRTEEYRKAEDRIGGFIAEHVIYDPDATVLQSALFAAYKGWCDVEGLDRLDRLGPKKFPAEFLERGRVRRAEDEKKRHIFRGARLRLSANPENPENPENLGPFADFSESPMRGESPENASDSPDSPKTVGSGPVVDLFAEGLRIFGRDLIELVSPDIEVVAERRPALWSVPDDDLDDDENLDAATLADLDAALDELSA